MEITTTLDGDASVVLSRGGTWLQTGGDLSISNTLPADRIHPELYTSGLLIEWKGRALLSGGTMTVSGAMQKSIETNGELILSGAELNLRTADIGLWANMLSRVTHLGGITTIRANRTAIDCSSSFTMKGGTVVLNAPTGISAHSGYVRFLGGETRIDASCALTGWEYHFLYGDGIQIAYEDGTAPVWEDSLMHTDRRPVTVMDQSVSAQQCLLHPSVPGSQRMVTGNPVQLEVFANLTSPTGTVSVELPFDSRLDESGVWVDGHSAAYTLTDTGFQVEAENSSYITFLVIHSSGGAQTLTARAEGLEFPLTYSCSDMTFGAPSATHDPEIAVTGYAKTGCTVTIYAEALGALNSTVVNSIGSWRTTAVLPRPGTYRLYAIVTDPAGDFVAVSTSRKVAYEPEQAVLQTLTVGNRVHGPTEESPHEYREVVFDYPKRAVSSGYYSYWPELPMFDFTAKFEDDSGSPDNIKDVYLYAIDENGTRVNVPMTYDDAAGTWVASHEFCGYNSIVPAIFGVSWRSILAEDRETVEPRVPEDEDLTTGQYHMLSADEAGIYRLELAPYGSIHSITAGSGYSVTYTLEENFCCFPVEPGEFYVVRTYRGQLAQWPDTEELTIIVQSDGDRRVVQYQPDVQFVDGTTQTDWTETYFRSANHYREGDVLLIDGTDAVTVTAVRENTYFYAPSSLDEVYSQLDMEQTEQELEQAFLESALFAAYESALEQTAAEFVGGREFEFELDDDTSCSVTVEYSVHGSTLKPSPTLELSTTMITKLPKQAPQKTTLRAELAFEIEEALDYYKAVLWAVENGVTNGLDATHFGPYAHCNRAQVVTFLHRSLGSPAMKNPDIPFSDVPEGQWFTAPVLWAVENGITNGLSADSFGPNALCNRAQIVTYLYRTFA